MKKIENTFKNNLFKKLFVKLCRIFGYEIIDQSNFFVPTSRKQLNDTLSIQGKKSINLPLGEVKITRKVKSLDIIVRTCSSVKMLTQNKDRIFQKEKIEYTLRSIKSILSSVERAKECHKNVNFKIIIVDHNSSEENLNKIKNLFLSTKLKYDLLNLRIEEFDKKINKINQQKKQSTENQISNMCNIYKSLKLSKAAEDLIYFVEDDYIHERDSISEMIFAFERISSQMNSEIIICPSDYPFLYMKAEETLVFLGENYHWRRINETLCTFLMSKITIDKYWNKLVSMCEQEHYPFEAPLHDIYKEVLCVSPIPSLAIHCTNINSAFGLSPNTNWKKLWDENEI